MRCSSPPDNSRGSVGEGTDAAALERLAGAWLALGARHLQQIQRQRHVLQRRQVGQHVKRLEDKADMGASQPRQCIIVERCKIGRIEQHAPAVGTIESGDDVEQRRFAAAGFADDGEELARAQAETDVIEHPRCGGAITLTQCFQRQQRPRATRRV
jgi:hypothetical protein